MVNNNGQITNLRNRYKYRKKGFADVSEYHFILDPKQKYFRKKQNSLTILINGKKVMLYKKIGYSLMR